MYSETHKKETYFGKKVLITGGLGFLGSNLAHALVAIGASVTIIDNLAPLYGGNLFNINEIKDSVKLIIGDIRDQSLINQAVLGQDIIFSFAAQVSHTDSASIPFEDLDINAKGHLTILEACRIYNPGVKILFSSSRLALGKVTESPILENHPTEPLSLYGVHKLLAEKYYKLYWKQYGIRTTVFRITNPYGPRQQIKHSKYSMPGWFLRLAMEKKTISIYGDGEQLRDYIYVEDIVQAFLLAGITEATNGELYNCGYGKSITFKQMAEQVVTSVGTGIINYVPWPENYEKEETGHCEMDITKLSMATGWKPSIQMKQGLEEMIRYYKENWDHYVE